MVAARSSNLLLAKRRRLSTSYDEENLDLDSLSAKEVPSDWHLVVVQRLPLDPTVGDSTFPWLILEAAEGDC